MPDHKALGTGKENRMSKGKKIAFIVIKVFLTIVALLGGLLALTNIKLQGFNIAGWQVSAEAVNMFVNTAGDYLFWIYVMVVIFIIWRKWIKKK